MKTKDNVWPNVCWSGQTYPTFHTTMKNKICFRPRSIKLCSTLPNKCYETKQGGQTSPTFHQTFVFDMLGEMFNLFDRGLTKIAYLHTQYFTDFMDAGQLHLQKKGGCYNVQRKEQNTTRVYIEFV